mgnify:FL=1|jgi:hypothetical protein
MRVLLLMAVTAACAACAHSGGPAAAADREYQRIDYYESVFAPLAQACISAGGFLIFEDTARNSPRHRDLSYSDMRMAVMRGCAGT